jgi:hypothetical protein
MTFSGRGDVGDKIIPTIIILDATYYSIMTCVILIIAWHTACFFKGARIIGCHFAARRVEKYIPNRRMCCAKTDGF